MKKYQFPKSEHGIQAAFFNWVRRNRKKSPNKLIREALSLCYAIPNGLPTNQFQKAYAEGLTKGIPDINLDFPVWRDISFRSSGLRIEMKYGENKLSEAQKEIKQLLTRVYFHYVVCYSTLEAVEAVVEYLPFPREDYIEPEYF